jgi:DNA primase
MDAVNEVKSRLNVEDVVAQYVQLKRSGRNYKGLSPWTNEKTASFIVSPEKQIWHDFSSGKGGDIFSFVMEMEGLDFRGALEHLARQAGVDLEELNSPQAKATSRFKARALEALELAAKFYQKQLVANNSAVKYLRDRKFTKETLLAWRLGYAPNTGRALVDFLTKHGFTTDEIRRAGLSVERQRRPVDMFRGRIMIPLADSRGAVIGFTARLLTDDPNAPKYINTPQTVTYDKSRQVFGLHLAKEAVRKEGFVVVVEGNFDVIASHQAGVANVVASAGTAMTERHLRELKRFSGDIRLCFDADSAGLSATERIIPIAQKVGVNLRIVSLINAKDPDELIHNDLPAWQQAIKKAADAPDWLIERYRDELDLKTGRGKRAFTDTLLPTIRRLQDPVEQEHYLKRLAELTDSSLEAIKAKSGQASESSATLRRMKPQAAASAIDKDAMEYQRLQDHFLSMTLMRPKLRPLLKDCQADFFNQGDQRVVFNFLKANPAFKGEPQLAKELQQVSNYVKIMTLQFEEIYADLAFEDLQEQTQTLKHRLIDRYVKIQKRQLMTQMQATQDESKIKILIQKVDKLNQLIHSSKISEETLRVKQH